MCGNHATIRKGDPMYIDRECGEYFKSYLNCLEETKRRKFITAIKKVCGAKVGVHYKNINIDDLCSTDRMDIDAGEMITPDMLKKAFYSMWKSWEEYEAYCE
jgi:hypothetical protein